MEATVDVTKSQKKNNGSSGDKPFSDPLEKYIRLMDEQNLHELEISDGNFHVKLVRQSQAPAVHYRPAASATAPAASKKEPELPKGTPIKSPLAGIFYRSPSPQSPPFVKEGQVIAPETTLCIVEAMKVLNEIKSEIGGKIVKILIENGNPIQTGQTLFIVEPT